MEANEALGTIEKIEALWEKKRGLIYSLIIVTVCFFLCCKFFISDYNLNQNINFTLPALYVIITVLWIFTTYRIPLKKGNQIGLYISISCDNDAEHKIKTLFSALVDQIKRERKLKLLWVRLLPINHFKTTSEIEAWVNKMGFETTIIFLDVKSGNLNSEEKINIDAVSFTGYFKKNNIIINNKENFNILADLSLRTQNKDLSYFEKNSLTDKEKLRNNLKDIIIYYAGMYCINEEKYETARILLKYLYNPNLTKVKGVLNEVDKSKVDINFKTENLQAARLNFLLTNLYLTCTINRLKDNKPKEAIVLLKEVENYDISNEIKLKIYMNFAYLYYLVGDLPNSKIYNKKIQEINPYSFAYAINLGYYAIIENDHSGLVQAYSMINENGPLDSNPVEIIAFLSDNQHKYPSSKILFELAGAAITKLFVDENEGNIKLKEVLPILPSGHQHKRLKKYCEKTLNTKWPKRVQRKREKEKRKRNK